MAIVQYQVMYKYVNPVTNVPCTNNSKEDYNELKFIRDYLPKEASSQVEETILERDPSNPKYDMLFVYSGVSPINKDLKNELYNSNNTQQKEVITVIGENFTRCKGEAWFISSTHASLKSALNSAKALVLALGNENVKVAKLVPLDITVGLE